VTIRVSECCSIAHGRMHDKFSTEWNPILLVCKEFKLCWNRLTGCLRVCFSARRILTNLSAKVTTTIVLLRWSNIVLTSTAASAVYRSTLTSSPTSTIAANSTPRNYDWLAIWHVSASAPNTDDRWCWSTWRTLALQLKFNVYSVAYLGGGLAPAPPFNRP